MIKALVCVTLSIVLFTGFPVRVNAQEADSDQDDADELERLEVSFFSSPKLGGGNMMQGSLRYNWSRRYSSRIGFAYTTDTFNVEYDDDAIVDSLGLVTNDEYRLDIVPFETMRNTGRWALGINTTVETNNEYGFYRTAAAGPLPADEGYILSFEESRLRVFISPRVGWAVTHAFGAIALRSQLWISPLFLASLDTSYRYEYNNEGEQEKIIDGIGFGYPEIEIDASVDFGRFFRLDLVLIYRYFLLDELELLFDENQRVFFEEVETEYDMLRLLAAGSLPITLPNGTQFRVGAGLLLYMERDLTHGLERMEPGVSLIFGVE